MDFEVCCVVYPTGALRLSVMGRTEGSFPHTPARCSTSLTTAHTVRMNTSVNNRPMMM